MFKSKHSLFFSGALLVAFIAAFSLFPRGESSLQDQKQPPMPVEVESPVPLPVEVAPSTPLPVEVQSPVEVEEPVEVEASAPLPVEVQESDKMIIQAQVSLPFEASNDLDATQIFWARPDGTVFTEIPADHILFITDILVARTPTTLTDDSFQVVFSDIAPDGIVSREFDIGGSSTNLPYSHSFTTPKFVRFTEAGHKLGVARVTSESLQITLTGFLEPIAD
ncbi:MAG: hypothetical protein R3248_02650 [Candidatus Promineifilaceae bacterium]|nr:hypothetical protein [Candidatus Promineifilaceae bacterium]